MVLIFRGEIKMETIAITTNKHAEFVEITRQVQDAVSRSGVKDGTCTVFVPHTTAGITTNEHADPDVAADMITALDRIVPWKMGYTHAEGNSAAHIKAAMLGVSQTIIVEDGQLRLGTWQGIFFAEFDGPRRREAWVTVAGI